jgi:DNA anti-recombination protein RmuC
MFDNIDFEKWLDLNAQTAMEKVTSGKGLDTQDIILLTLKAQTNHIAHLDQDLRGEMKALRIDMDKRFEQVNKRFEQVDKRFEQIQANMDRRFESMNEKMDRRFESMNQKMDSFMKWSLGTLFAFSGLIIGVIKYL